MSNFSDEFKKFWAQPFSADMSARDWFLFLGLLIIFVGLWNVILYHLFTAVRGE